MNESLENGINITNNKSMRQIPDQISDTNEDEWKPHIYELMRTSKIVVLLTYIENAKLILDYILSLNIKRGDYQFIVPQTWLNAHELEEKKTNGSKFNETILEFLDGSIHISP